MKHSDFKGVLMRTLLVVCGMAAVAGGLHWLGVGLKLLFAIMVFIAFVALVMPYYGLRLLESATTFVRGLYWARDMGHFHSFGGVPLHVEDDGRYVWLDGPGLLRVLGRREAEDVLAARLTGNWRRNEKGQLMLRVDAVIDYLGHMPERTEPRVQKFRRYLEREVLFPAAERRRRS